MNYNNNQTTLIGVKEAIDDFLKHGKPLTIRNGRGDVQLRARFEVYGGIGVYVHALYGMEGEHVADIDPKLNGVENVLRGLVKLYLA